MQIVIGEKIREAVNSVDDLFSLTKFLKKNLKSIPLDEKEKEINRSLEVSPEEAKYVVYLCSRYKIFKMEDIINKEGNSQEEQDNIRNFISRIYDSGFLYLS